MSANPAESVTVDAQTARIFEWRRGFNAMHLIDIGLQLGLFKAFLEQPEATTVLQVGCGTGRHLLQLAKAFSKARVIGADIDPTGLQLARAAVDAAGLAGRVELVAGDLDSKVSAASADAVVMIEVLHEIAPALRQAVIDNCARALHSEGWLVIVDDTYPGTLEDARRPEFCFRCRPGSRNSPGATCFPRTRHRRNCCARRVLRAKSSGRSSAKESRS